MSLILHLIGSPDELEQFLRMTNNQAILHAMAAMEGRLMSAIDDLRALVTDMQAEQATDLDGIQTQLGALNTAAAAEIQRVNDALAALLNQDPALVDITAQLTNIKNSLHEGLTSAQAGIGSAVDALNAEIPDAPPTV